MTKYSDFLSMGNYGTTPSYQPMNPLELTQPAPQADWWNPAPAQPRMFPMATATGPVAEPAMPGMGNGAWLGGYEDMAPGMAPNPGSAGSGGGWNWLNTRDQQGMLSPAIQGVGALASLYMGMKQYGLAKDTLANSKAQFERNFEANKSTTNARLEDRQRRRVMEDPNAVGVDAYMSKYGVK